ncbi:MAG: TolC family protein [Chitinophagaceae bacterium]|nr:MAG: TolC family protein [Chitinophagaceae bacterium]
MKKLMENFMNWQAAASILCGCLSTPVAAQHETHRLGAAQLLEIVKAHHPVAKQASLKIEMAEAGLLSAKGSFDPGLRTGTSKKTVDDNRYYEYFNTELTLPTWIGADFRVGVESVNGTRPDPTRTTGKSNYLGVTVPLAKGLLTDKRRAVLQTARITRQASAVEKQKILNQLFGDAIKSYWYWAEKFAQYKLLDDLVQVNKARLRLTLQAFQLGDRAAVDTIEALAQLQTFQVTREKAWLEFQNAGLELSEYLWSEGDLPVAIPEGIVPDDQEITRRKEDQMLPSLDSLLTIAVENHPEAILLDYKIDVLEIDKRLKFQDLLPQANLDYNVLGKNYNLLKTTDPVLFANNHRYGLSFVMPLRFSQARGEYKKARIAITEAQLDRNIKRMAIGNKIKASYNEITALVKQIRLQETAYNSLQILQRAEEQRFAMGESSLFLINTRENKTLESVQKLIELKIKYQLAITSLRQSAGLLQD